MLLVAGKSSRRSGRRRKRRTPEGGRPARRREADDRSSLAPPSRRSFPSLNSHASNIVVVLVCAERLTGSCRCMGGELKLSSMLRGNVPCCKLCFSFVHRSHTHTSGCNTTSLWKEVMMVVSKTPCSVHPADAGLLAHKPLRAPQKPPSKHPVRRHHLPREGEAYEEKAQQRKACHSCAHY